MKLFIKKGIVIILFITLFLITFYILSINNTNVEYENSIANENIIIETPEKTIKNEISDDTKKYDKNLKIAYTDEKNKDSSKFLYSTEVDNTSYTWNDYIVENKAILNTMPEIDFSKFKELDNEFYSLKITDYEQYMEYATKYNFKQLEKSDFDNVFVEIIVRKSANNSIHYGDIINGYEYIGNEENYTFPVEIGGLLDITEEFRYPCLIAYFPNYMNKHCDDFYFKVIVKESDIKVSMESALKNAQEYLNKLEYKGFSGFSNMDYIRITKEYSNNFLSIYDKENPINNTDKKYMVWSISAYSNDDPCTWANVYVDIETGKIIGGILNWATD